MSAGCWRICHCLCARLVPCERGALPFCTLFKSSFSGSRSANILLYKFHVYVCLACRKHQKADITIEPESGIGDGDNLHRTCLTNKSMLSTCSLNVATATVTSLTEIFINTNIVLTWHVYVMPSSKETRQWHSSVHRGMGASKHN